MGSIVFGTIVENIKSFFGREDELMARPKAIPESASEVFEKTGERQSPQRIVEKNLPEQQPQLPFSPDDLRDALEKKQEATRTHLSPETPPRLELTNEMHEFDSVLSELDEPAHPPGPQYSQTHEQENDGFFGEFGQFLLREELDAEGLMEEDILHKMREFHKAQQDGKEYYIYSDDVKRAIERKLKELKMLEKEWFHTREQIDELQRGITGIEQEIETHTHDLKQLLKQAKSKSSLEKRVPQGEEFVLADGRKLASLLDLKIALRTMPQDVFHHHINTSRNDFAEWVAGTMDDPDLAEKIRAIRDQHQLDVFLSRMSG